MPMSSLLISNLRKYYLAIYWINDNFVIIIIIIIIIVIIIFIIIIIIIIIITFILIQEKGFTVSLLN